MPNSRFLVHSLFPLLPRCLSILLSLAISALRRYDLYSKEIIKINLTPESAGPGWIFSVSLPPLLFASVGGGDLVAWGRGVALLKVFR